MGVQLTALAVARREAFATGGRLSARRMAALLAWALACLTCAIGAALTRAAIPAPLYVDWPAGRVVDVAVGSYLWTAGIRSGQPAESIEVLGAAPMVRVALGDEFGVSVPSITRISGVEGLLGGAVFLIAAFAMPRVGMPGRSVALGVVGATSLGPLAPALGFPLALVPAAVPMLITWMALLAWSNENGRSRAQALAAAAIVGGTAMAVLAVTTITPGMEWPWYSLWNVPAAAVIAMGVISSAPTVIRSLKFAAPLRRRASLLLLDLLPAARSSHLLGSAQERSRLSTELHNAVLPELAQAILELDSAEPVGRARLGRLAESLRRLLADRQTSVIQHVGLADAVVSYVDGLEASIPVTVTTSTGDGRPRGDVELAAYRVIQLALRNALAHSSADAISVSVRAYAHEVALTVSDDGVGIDDDARRSAARRGHIGLVEMRQLAATVGADLAIRSVEESGTTVEFLWRR